VAVDAGSAKEEGVVVVSDDPVYEALSVEPRTLCLRLGRGDYIWYAKVLQQLLAVPAQPPTGQIRSVPSFPSGLVVQMQALPMHW
jgi:hypothetical protein